MSRGGAFDQLSDEDLVAICNDAGGDDAAAAFETLYRRHKDYVVHVAMRFVHDSDISLDVLQESFSYLLRRFPPPGPGLTLTAKLTTYLYPIAKNLAITQLRKSRRGMTGEAIDPDTLPAAPANPADDLGRMLQELSPERREVLTMRFVDDLSLAEIAEALGIPLGTVKSRLHLAVRQLRESPGIRKLYFP